MKDNRTYNKDYEGDMRFRKFAKIITKILRTNGIKAGLLKCNGTTSPVGADKYEAYIPIDKYYHTIKGRLFMSFNMDNGKTMAKIKKALDLNNICYAHDGDESSCVRFVPYPLEIKAPKKEA